MCIGYIYSQKIQKCGLFHNIKGVIPCYFRIPMSSPPPLRALRIHTFPAYDISCGNFHMMQRVVCGTVVRMKKGRKHEESLFDTDMYNHGTTIATNKRFCDTSDLPQTSLTSLNPITSSIDLMNSLPNCILEKIVYFVFSGNTWANDDALTRYRSTIRSLSSTCRQMKDIVHSLKFKGIKCEEWDSNMLPFRSMRKARALCHKFPDLQSLTLHIDAASNSHGVPIPSFWNLKHLILEINIDIDNAKEENDYNDERIMDAFILDIQAPLMEELTIRLMSSGMKSCPRMTRILLGTNLIAGNFPNLRKLEVIGPNDIDNINPLEMHENPRYVTVDFSKEFVKCISGAPLLQTVCIRRIGCAVYLIGQLFGDTDETEQDISPVKCDNIEIDWFCGMDLNALMIILHELSHTFTMIKVHVAECCSSCTMIQYVQNTLENVSNIKVAKGKPKTQNVILSSIVLQD